MPWRTNLADIFMQDRRAGNFESAQDTCRKGIDINHGTKQSLVSPFIMSSGSKQAFQGDRSSFNSYFDDGRKPITPKEKLRTTSEMKEYNRQNVLNKSVDTHVVQEIVKGIHNLADSLVEASVVEDGTISGICFKVVSLQQSIGMHPIRTTAEGSETFSKSEKTQAINHKWQLEQPWEYGYTPKPTCSSVNGKSFLHLQSKHTLYTDGLGDSRMSTLNNFPSYCAEHHTSAIIKTIRIDGMWKPSKSNTRSQKMLQAKLKRKLKMLHILKQLVCGGFAGVVSRTAVAPLDLIKTYLITSHSLGGSKKNALAICKDIVEQDGWKGLFRGNFVNCIRVAPSKAIELYVFETVRRALNKDGHPLKHFAATVAGGCAGMAGTIATYPLELIRTRLSVQPELYMSLPQAFCKIVKDEGFMAFYSGLTPSVVGVFPYAATNYFVYDGLRTAYCRSTGEKNVPTVPTLLFGAIAGAVSSAVTYPLEVARRQMQLNLAADIVKKSTVRVILDVYQHEGFLALYRGLGTTWLKLIPAAAISFVCYETARLALRIDEASLMKPDATIIAEQEA
ncbi:hypothetical protein KP509_24G073000 [Ceratopteris richardii]|uniref:Uncharacterized protein n=1 Tax=Ceratopteris richardii TaxID=49495 RepID=A0A8T2RYK0_CERRI|nr:hypothetical protein KP509_24G073000 [Ceratopteris richardii]KAH7300650.1 hypothetical protein KP509_24G073000 [Ceratopteris richardii]